MVEAHGAVATLGNSGLWVGLQVKSALCAEEEKKPDGTD